MKTSNRLLVFGTVFMMLLATSMLVFIKANVTIKKDEKRVVGNHEAVKKTVLESYNATNYNLDKMFTYVLDANRTGVSINAEENIIPLVEINNGRVLSFSINDTVSYDSHLPIEIIIGMKGKENFSLDLEDRANVQTEGQITANVVNLSSENKSNLELNLNAKVLNVQAEDRANVYIKGEVTVINIQNEDDSYFDIREAKVRSLNVSMEDEAEVEGRSVDSIMGVMSDYADIEMEEEWKAFLVETKDKARCKVNSPKSENNDQ